VVAVVVAVAVAVEVVVEVVVAVAVEVVVEVAVVKMIAITLPLLCGGRRRLLFVLVFHFEFGRPDPLRSPAIERTATGGL